MHEPVHIYLEKLRWLFFGIGGIVIVIAILVATSLLLPPPVTHASATTSRPSSYTAKTYDTPNAVTAGMSQATDEFGHSLASTGQTIGNGSRSALVAIAGAGSFIISGSQSVAAFVGHGLSSGAIFIARGVSSGVAFIAHVPNSLIGSATDTAIVGAIIKPTDNNMTVPVIDPTLPAIITASQPSAPQTTILQPDSIAAWPIHGEITTLFGVPHWPYQPRHSGIDISDGQRPGITQIKPFKPGRVVDAVRSNSGLGNHIIVDHGEGLMSVYGHLSSISVQIGQTVDKNTVLGLEGSTGASTGTHLHFEIRLNGQAMDPRQFVSGHP
jgi:hypothetical protein